MLWKFNRLSCIINVLGKQLNFYMGRKNCYLASSYSNARLPDTVACTCANTAPTSQACKQNLSFGGVYIFNIFFVFNCVNILFSCSSFVYVQRIIC